MVLTHAVNVTVSAFVMLAGSVAVATLVILPAFVIKIALACSDEISTATSTTPRSS